MFAISKVMCLRLLSDVFAIALGLASGQVGDLFGELLGRAGWTSWVDELIGRAARTSWVGDLFGELLGRPARTICLFF